MERLKQANHLTDLIEIKRKRLPEGSVILNPDMIQPHTAAVVMDTILSAVYGKHNLMPTKEQLENQIRNREILPWFIVHGNQPIACAALIVGQNSVEIGRAANHPEFGHNGSLLMLEAIAFHQKNHRLPLTAEIRLADEFKGIIGGQASQTTLFKHARFKPFAAMPAFHHPGPHGPDRQEFFFFCLDRLPKQPKTVFLPERLANNPFIGELQNSLFPLAEVIFVSQKRSVNIGFQMDSTPPFNILQPKLSGESLEKAMKLAKKPFTLASIPLTEENSFLIDFLTDQGFVPCGLGWEKQPTIFLGKLNPKVILAPIGLASNCFSAKMEKGILKTEEAFRKQTEKQ